MGPKGKQEELEEDPAAFMPVLPFLVYGVGMLPLLFYVPVFVQTFEEGLPEASIG